MIDVHAAEGTFADKRALARDLAAAVMKWEQVPPISLFEKNTAAFIHELPAEAISNVSGDSDYVRVQVLNDPRCPRMALPPCRPADERRSEGTVSRSPPKGRNALKGG